MGAVIGSVCAAGAGGVSGTAAKDCALVAWRVGGAVRARTAVGVGWIAGSIAGAVDGNAEVGNGALATAGSVAGGVTVAVGWFAVVGTVTSLPPGPGGPANPLSTTPDAGCPPDGLGSPVLVRAVAN